MQSDNVVFILQIFYGSMILFMLSFGGICLYLHWSIEIGPFLTINEWIRYSVLFLLILIIWFSNRTFKNRLLYAAAREELTTKLNHYRMAYIIRMSLMELAALIPMVFYLLTGRSIFMVYAAVLFIYFLSIFPTAGKVLQDLQLSADQRQKLENKL